MLFSSVINSNVEFVVVVMEICLMLFVSSRCRDLVLFAVSNVYSSHGDMLDAVCE